MKFEIVPLGDLAVRVSFGDEIEKTTNERIRQFIVNLQKESAEGVVECVPAYTSVTVYYEPNRISYSHLVEKLRAIYLASGQSKGIKPVVYEIPVWYGDGMGPDLAYVAQYHGMSERDVIELHANKEYLIHMIGFMPGFPYLGGLPDEIAVPRLEKPRRSVEPGAVGIGGNQTGIYPADVPSGWRIIGVTPVILFDLERENPFLFSSGNYIKFKPIDQDEFLKIKEMGASYQVKTYSKE